ncbi:hypothetical protein ACFYY2_07515 [Streptomyces sp. NPDC001822]|uniref:hypothetical protein n=1 Tax=Streptomyces sp. NPDC001822 TaxID=3364614 RepID=UPI0036B0B643
MTTTSGSTNGGTPPVPPVGPPSRKSNWRRARDWFRGLSEMGKVGVVVALITVGGGLLTAIVGALVTAAVTGDDESGGDAKGAPSVSQSLDPTREGDSGAATEPTESASPPASPAPSKATYSVVYQDQKMSLGLPDFPRTGSLDFDEPASRTWTKDAWAQKVDESEAAEQPLEQDLSYQNDLWGYLAVRDGRNAAQIEEAPKSAEDCVRSANLGGFTEAQMSEWPLKLHQRFCILTDKGNVVSAEITRLVGGERNSYTDPPTQIEFTATMWQLG